MNALDPTRVPPTPPGPVAVEKEHRILDWLEAPALCRGEFLVFWIVATIIVWSK